MATLVLVLPTLTPGATTSSYSHAQLAFTAIASLALYGTFVFVQTIRHRDYFLPPGEGDLQADAHASPPSGHRAVVSLGLKSEEHTSELQSLMRISYAVFCLKK